MARWRDTKAGKTAKKQPSSQSKPTNPNIEVSAPLISRIKALITDSFMLLMPIMYIVIYLIMGSGDLFSQNMLLGWALILTPYWIITNLFLVFKGQTPGLKAYELKVVNSKTHDNIGYLKASFRFIIYIFSVMSIVLMFVPFFREDKKTLQDLLLNTTVIEFPNNQ